MFLFSFFLAFICCCTDDVKNDLNLGPSWVLGTVPKGTLPKHHLEPQVF